MTNWITQRPIAHRGLHDLNKTVFENTLSAAQRAVEKNYAIEMDLQWTSDGVPVVFHDDTLERLTDHTGKLRETPSSTLQTIKIGGTTDTIPTLQQLLDTVGGKVGLILELKGEEGADDGFVKAVADILRNYKGNVALMSFNHHLLRDARAPESNLPPDIPLGLTAMGNGDELEIHKKIDIETGVDFISYDVDELPNDFVSSFRAENKPVICWTVKTSKQLTISRQYCDQPTFEGIDPE